MSREEPPTFNQDANPPQSNGTPSEAPAEAISEDTLPAPVEPTPDATNISLKNIKPNLLVNILSYLPFEILMILDKITSHLWPFLGIEIALRENLDSVSASFAGYLEERRRVQIQQYMHHLQYAMDKVDADEILSSSGIAAQMTLTSPKMDANGVSTAGIEYSPAQQSHLQEHRMRVISILRILLGFKMPRTQMKIRFTRSLDQEHWLVRPLRIRRITSEKAQSRKIRLQKKRLQRSGATRFYVTPSVNTGQRSSKFYSFEGTPTSKNKSKKDSTKKSTKTPSSAASTPSGKSPSVHTFASPRNLTSPTNSSLGVSPRTIRTPLTPPDNLQDQDLELLLSQLFEHCSSVNLLVNSIHEEKLEFILPYVNSLNAVNYIDLEPLKSYKYIMLWILAVLDFRRHLQLYSWYFSGADLSSLLLRPHSHILGSTTIGEENEKGCLGSDDTDPAISAKYTYQVTTTPLDLDASLSSPLTGVIDNAQDKEVTRSPPKETTITLPPVPAVSAQNGEFASASNTDTDESSAALSDLEAVPKLNLKKAKKNGVSLTQKSAHKPKTPLSGRNTNSLIQSPRSSASFIQSPRERELFPPNVSQEPQKTLPMSTSHKFEHMSKDEFEKRKMRRQQRLVQMEKMQTKQKKATKTSRKPFKMSQPMRPTSRLEVLLDLSQSDTYSSSMRLTPKRIEEIVERKLNTFKKSPAQETK